ncbi:hypothetical protein P3X46_004453 [Hevea brasiliensis]|uniref:Myb-like domain-containing protein n=1 Tax=Hevea brasiliensis TaxID=3981 RepID=A0ABQ9MXQ1_HEVBR|nr:uncharacterized protein LOC110668935 isoform X1 [Hevea brasiliensis]XP_021686045.2 uncharacterized protein LOC110668935 isoform X1 [Hevea brasiliensis]KAJ9184758.1 hypothetical protein P3X46_004453 [Hevea brasiliensis]
MGDPSISDSSLEWLWTIEYLASFRQLDPSILQHLINAAPILPEDLGKSTREMVSLRCLEHLFGNSNEVSNDVPSVTEPKHIFDFSGTCEDVLKSILKETSVSDLRMSGSDLSKWDIHRFIEHKRASMPKRALEKLKDAILKGTHPYAASLTELRGILHKNDENDKITVDSCHHNAVTGRIDIDDTNTQTMAPEGSTFSLPVENKNGMVGGDSHHRNLLPFKRNKSYLDDENPAGEYQEDQGGVGSGDLLLNVKRFKSNPTERIFIPRNGKELVEDSSERMVGVIEKGSCHMERESQVEGPSECRSLENGHDKFVTTEGLGRSCNASVSAEIQHNQRENADNAKKMPSDTSGDGPSQHILMDEVHEAEHIELNGTCVRTLHKVSIHDAKAAVSLSGFHSDTPVDKLGGMEHVYEEDTSSDGDEHHFSKVDVAMEKNRFLSSQCTLNHVSPTNWTELNLCVKCGKDGQFLVCNAVGCPLVVHKECLGSLPRFDEEGKFYCPFCAYSLAISEYMEAKKRASLARKELSAFINKQTESSHSKEDSKLNHYGDEDPMSGNFGDRESDKTNNGGYALRVNGQLKKRRGDRQPVEPMVSCTDVKLMGQEEEPDATHAMIHVSPGEKEREEMAPECLRGLDREDQTFANPESSGDNPVSKNNEFFSLNEKQAEGLIQKDVLEQQSGDSFEKPVHAIEINQGDISDERNEEKITSNCSIRFRRREAQYVYPAIPQLRRKKVHWTDKEEEMLKEGVQKFSNTDERAIPWKKILEYGSSVFLRGRTTVDLKDKWRNMCKGSPKCK